MALAAGTVSLVLKRFTSTVRGPNQIWRNKGFMCKMSTQSATLTHSITLPNKQSEPVRVVAAPGVSHSDFWSAIDSSLFKQWLHNLQCETGVLADDTMSLRQVLIQGVDMFGKRVGFLKFKADIFDKETGKKLPGIVFARGPAVAVLILLESEGETYAVLTEQARVPVGRIILELPAGMLDDDKGDFVGTAVREVEEETGITLNLEDMVDLTAFLDSSTGCRVFPSGGGCDEEISIFLYRGRVDKAIITQLQGKETGLREHGELIKVEEEIGIKLKREDMIDLIALDDSIGCRVFPSPEAVIKKSVSFCTEEVLTERLSHSYGGKRLAFVNSGAD